MYLFSTLKWERYAKRYFSITQKDVSDADLYVELVNGQELRIKRKGILSTLDYRINILILKDQSSLKFTFGWRWFLAGVVVCLLLLPNNWRLLIVPELYLDVAFYAGIIICIYCFLWCGKRRSSGGYFFPAEPKLLFSRWPLVSLQKKRF